MKLGAALFSIVFASVAVAFGAEQSQVVKLDSVPAAAQKAILAETGNGKGRLGEIDQVRDGDETWYDVELIKGKVERSFSVAPDGKLLSWQVFMREIPEAARKAIHDQAQAAKGKLGDINRVLDEGKVTYEVELTRDGRELSFTVGEDGKLLDQDVALADTPEKVQKAIRAKTAGGVLTKIEKNTEDEDGEVSYDVEAEQGGKKITFSVDADGELLDD